MNGIVWNEAAGGVAETLVIAQEVQQDLEQLKPNVVLETVKGWVPGLMTLGYRIVFALVILMIGFRIARMVQKAFEKTFNRVDMEISLKKFLLSMIYAVVCGLVIFIAAEKIGISSASIIAILGSAGLALGLSLQNQLSNFAGGIVILALRPFKVGDYISCGGQEGTVSAIGLIYTTLYTADNRQITLPNGSLSNSSVVNVTAQKMRRLDMKVGIGYESDLKLAKEILRDLFLNHPLVQRKEEVNVFVDDLGDSAVMLGARGWVNTGDYWNVKWELTEKIKLTFDEAGIEIPYQQVDIHQKL